MKYYLALILTVCTHSGINAQQGRPWAHLPQGPNIVGFTTEHLKGKKGDNLSIGIWYPAGKGGERMSLKDYIIESKETPATPDTAATNEFKRVLELPFLYHLPAIADTDFKQAINVSFSAYKNAPIQKGKFPLIITYTLPEAFPETFEFFASHGFVVASVSARLKDVSNDTLLYVHATDILEEFMGIIKEKPYVDTTRIAAFGHGWSFQPSFYLAMRDTAIKLLVNMESGVFGPRSKTTLSPDYDPARLKIPMLHIVTPATKADEDDKQFNALSNPRYVVLVKSADVSHHDFSIWGRVVDVGLDKRGDAKPIVEAAFANAHALMLYFLVNGRLDETVVATDLFAYSVFGK